MFFLCALAVSGVNEGINWFTRVRAKFLWAYLYELFERRSGDAGPSAGGEQRTTDERTDGHDRCVAARAARHHATVDREA